MSIVAVALVSTRDGRPLYLRDFSDTASLLFSDPFDDDSADLFDDEHLPAVGAVTDEQRREWPCAVGYQFALHSAHGRLSEVVDGGEGQWKPPPGSSGADCNWVGWLCNLDTTRAYGYVSTNVRYIVLVENTISPENQQAQAARDGDLKTALANLHKLYTDHVLNPFTVPASKIALGCRFDLGCTSMIQRLNESF